MRTTTGSGIGGNRGRWLAGEGQREQEGHAALGQILRPDIPAVRLDDSLADREAESGAPAAGHPAIELLEHLVFLAARQSGTVVGDLDGDGLAGRRRDDANGVVVRRLLHGIVEYMFLQLLDEDVVVRHQVQVWR